MRIGSLCTGYGGLDMAAENVFGATTAWVSDIDKGACKIIAHRYPNIPNIGDMTAVDWAAVEPVDIITGGTPCQDLSHAGKRAGMTEGTRSNLWVAMREAINIVRPQYVIWENVRGAYSAGADSALEHCAGCMGGGRPGLVLRALGRVLGDLSDLGYDCQWRGLRAADVGAPHGRFRVFIAAHTRSETGQLRAGLREDESARDGRRQPARSGGSAGLGLLPTPRATDGTHGGPNQRGSRGDLMLTSAVLLPTPDASPEKYRLGGDSQQSKSLPAMAIRGELDLLPTPSAADALGGHERRGGSRGDELLLNGMAKAGHLARFGVYADAIARWENTIGRPAPDPTELTGRNNAPRLSPKFTEWMMGAPQGWITDTPGLTRNEALKACGNGVVPQQAEAALRHMLATEVAA